MESANLQYVEMAELNVEMAELMDRSGEYIAGLLGAEGAYVTSGCGAALALSAAACIAGSDPDKVLQLPDVTGLKHEILIQKLQRYTYDRCLSSTGGKLVEVGDDDGCTVEQLESAITAKTAAVAYLVRPDESPGALSLEETVETAHANGLPVIADAAAQNYPTDFFLHNARAADLVCFRREVLRSAPSPTGFLCGKKELVDAAAAHGFIGFHTGGARAIGRPLKVTRDGVVAVVAAVRAWLTMGPRVPGCSLSKSAWLPSSGGCPAHPTSRPIWSTIPGTTGAPASTWCSIPGRWARTRRRSRPSWTRGTRAYGSPSKAKTRSSSGRTSSVRTRRPSSPTD